MPDDVVIPPTAEPVKETPPPSPPPSEPKKEEVPPPPAEPAKEPAKPADDKAGKTDSTEPPAKPVVPEKYDLKLPEDSLLDAKAMARIEANAKAQGLSQDKAQELLANEHRAVVAYVDEQSEAWLQQTQNDKEIGGAAYKESVFLADRAVKQFGSDGFKSFLNKYGIGNNPEFVRTFSKIGRAMANDKAVFPGGQGPVESKSAEEVLYGKKE